MGSTVQVRLDDAATAALRAYSKRTGMSASQILRKGLHLAMQQEPLPASARIAGLGEFDFGVADLSTNERYMEGFGRIPQPGGRSRKAVKR